VAQNFAHLKSVRRIIQLGEPVVQVHDSEDTPRKKKKKKKQSWLLRPIEKAARTLVEAQQAAAATYLEAHDRSARKEKDGWVLDLGRNSRRAWRAGVRQLTRPL